MKPALYHLRACPLVLVYDPISLRLINKRLQFGWERLGVSPTGLLVVLGTIVLCSVLNWSHNDCFLVE